MITIKNLTYQQLLAIDKFYFEKGIYRLKGANGAGKTTLLEILSGFRASTGLESTIKKGNCLYLSEHGVGLEHLSLAENMRMAAWSMGRRLPDTCLSSIYTAEQAQTVYRKASLGMQSMVGLSLLWASPNWELIILDETLSALDQHNRQLVFSKLITMQDKAVIIIVSHSDDIALDYQAVELRGGQLYAL